MTSDSPPRVPRTQVLGAFFRVRPCGPYIPIQHDDYCPCPRGSEALRWHKEALRAFPALLEQYPPCPDCDPSTGVVRWEGYTEAGGTVLLGPYGPLTLHP